jgi:hypothetical protein
VSELEQPHWAKRELSNLFIMARSELNRSDNERQWALRPAALHTPLNRVCESDDAAIAPFEPPVSCPHELWVILNLDDNKWASYSTFTLRLSWAASVSSFISRRTSMTRVLESVSTTNAYTVSHAHAS